MRIFRTISCHRTGGHVFCGLYFIHAENSLAFKPKRVRNTGAGCRKRRVNSQHPFLYSQASRCVPFLVDWKQRLAAAECRKAASLSYKIVSISWRDGRIRAVNFFNSSSG